MTALLDLPGLTYTRAGTATAWRADGTLAEFAANMPRITDAGITIEGPRTNLLTRWDPTAAQIPVKAGCVDAVAPTIAPLLGRNWISLDNTSAPAYGYQTATISASALYTAQLLVETPDGSQPFHIDNSAPSGDFVFYVGGGPLSGVTTNYRRVAGNVWLVSITGTTIASPNQNNGLLRRIGQNARTVKFSGFQLEQASTPSTPIITSGAVATRGTDNLRLSGLAATFASPFTVVSEVASADNSTAARGLVTVTSETNPSFNRMYIYRDPFGPVTAILRANDLVVETKNMPGSNLWTGSIRAAFTFDGTTMRWAVRGVLGPPLSMGAAVFTSPLSRMEPCSTGAGANTLLDGVGRRTVILPFALSDADLMRLSQ